MDIYTIYAASAVSAATVIRYFAGFGFPLFAPAVYTRLGQGWGNSLLAFLAIGLGWPMALLLWVYGDALSE